MERQERRGGGGAGERRAVKSAEGFDNIVAPFDGVVTARNVDIGSLVKADSNDGAALFAVADIHQMRVYVRAPESYSAATEELV